MNILISPNAFKGTLDAQKASEIIEEFIASNFKDFNRIISPVADGGDGTCSLLTKALKISSIESWSLNAYGQPISSFFGFDDSNKTAYIDVSTASGLGSLNGIRLEPKIASTYGTGLLIQEAINLGANEIILGLGGSATIDLGIGILANLGIEFLDEKGRKLTPFSPDYLLKIRHIQRAANNPKVKFSCLCDVKNPLFGISGALPVFGPQKGLVKQDFDQTEKLLVQLIEMMYAKSKNIFRDSPGFGAAGGIAAGLSAFFNTELKIGSSYFLDLVDFESKLAWADLIITGEGRYDSQSKEGKAAYELLIRTKRQGKKIGIITSGNEADREGFDLVIKLPDLDFSSKNLNKQAEKNLMIALNSSKGSSFWK